MEDPFGDNSTGDSDVLPINNRLHVPLEIRRLDQSGCSHRDAMDSDRLLAEKLQIPLDFRSAGKLYDRRGIHVYLLRTGRPEHGLSNFNDYRLLHHLSGSALVCGANYQIQKLESKRFGIRSIIK